MQIICMKSMPYHTNFNCNNFSNCLHISCTHCMHYVARTQLQYFSIVVACISGKMLIWICEHVINTRIHPHAHPHTPTHTPTQATTTKCRHTYAFDKCVVNDAKCNFRKFTSFVFDFISVRKTIWLLRVNFDLIHSHIKKYTHSSIYLCISLSNIYRYWNRNVKQTIAGSTCSLNVI